MWKLLERLKADGLVVHVNPIQEWFQPEGDRYLKPPIEVIGDLLGESDYPIIVKEVGQGMGPESLKALMKLPIEAIEFAAYGGTNFARVELMRGGTVEMEQMDPLSSVGHDAEEMTLLVNRILDTDPEVRCKQLIISGGINSYLDGYYLIKLSKVQAVYGQASNFFKLFFLCL